MKTIYDHIIDIQTSGEKAVLCTVVRTFGSTPLKAGAKLLVTETKFFGTVGGGTVERRTIDRAKLIFNTRNAEYLVIELNSKNESTCGGKVELFLEPINMKEKLYIFGAGHVGKELALATQKLDFDITVIDNREEIVNDWDGIKCNVICKDFDEYLASFVHNQSDMIAILTYDHNIDFNIISTFINEQWHYLGLMGSKNKVRAIKRKLQEKNVHHFHELIDRIDMPIGLDINAVSAPEIAISIAAKLIKERAKLKK